jgi:adenylate kinase
MITVVLTGMSGSERRGLVAELASFAAEQGRRVHFIDLWQEMQIAEPSVSEATILNIADARRSQIVRQAISAVQTKLEALQRESTDRNSAVILGTHATFFWNSSYLEGFPETHLAGLQPEAFFTVEHNAVDTFDNLRADPLHRFDQISLLDVLHWRDRETEDTARWARNLRVPHYLISRSEPIKGLFSLLFQPGTRKIYASYPMSYVTEQHRRAAESLIGDLREKGYVVFNPGTLEDMEQVGALLDQRAKGAGLLAHVSEEEVVNLLRAVGDHTVKRDYQLIDQSDLVVVYYPPIRYKRFDTRSKQVKADTYIPLSAGVICEIVHGHATGKRVYAIWLPKYTPSPFFTYHVFRTAGTKRELLKIMAQLDPP